MPSELHSIVLDRTFHVPAARLYAVLTDPASVWAGTEGVAVAADVRVGGRFRIAMKLENSNVVFAGEYRTLEPGARVVHSIHYEAGNAPPLSDEYLEFLLQPSGPKETDLLMAHCWRGPDRPADVRKGFQKIWTKWLDALQAALLASISPRDRMLRSLEQILSIVLTVLIISGFIATQFFNPPELLIKLYALCCGAWGVALLAWLCMRFLPTFQFTLRQLYFAIFTLQVPMALLLMSQSSLQTLAGALLLGLWSALLVIRIYLSSFREKPSHIK